MSSLLVVAAPVRAQTVITSPLTSFEWNEAGSPYLVEETVNVPQGETLSVGPGTRVEFAGTAGLSVSGSIIVSGTATKPVTFTNLPPATEWLQIGITPSVQRAEFRHAHFENNIASLLLFVDAIVEHCTFSNSGAPVIVIAGTTEVRASLFDLRSGAGTSVCQSTGRVANISVCGDGRLLLYNSIVRSSSTTSLVIDASETASASEIVNTTFVHSLPASGTAISLSPEATLSPVTLVKNSIVTGFDLAIEVLLPQPDSGPFVQISHNDFFENVATTNGPVADASNLFADPAFVGPDDFHLQASSALLDQAEPHVGIDDDFGGVPRPTTGWDIGAHELPVCGDGVVWAEEQCDDGNTSNGDGCLNDCTRPAVCGDGVHDAATEGCDDGNVSNRDACLNNCAVAQCGDGFIRTGVEACDDANRLDGDGCEADCTLSSDVRRAADANSGGCAAVATSSPVSGAMLLLAVGAVLRRRL